MDYAQLDATGYQTTDWSNDLVGTVSICFRYFYGTSMQCCRHPWPRPFATLVNSKSDAVQYVWNSEYGWIVDIKTLLSAQTSANQVSKHWKWVYNNHSWEIEWTSAKCWPKTQVSGVPNSCGSPQNAAKVAPPKAISSIPTLLMHLNIVITLHLDPYQKGRPPRLGHAAIQRLPLSRVWRSNRKSWSGKGPHRCTA